MSVREKGRLSLLAAAMVVARRDFTAILFSRSFIFFLLGPLFPVVVGALAGSVGSDNLANNARPTIGVAMPARDAERMIAAAREVGPQMGDALPDFELVLKLQPGETYDAARALTTRRSDLAGILTGSLAQPVLNGPPDRMGQWQGPVGMVAARAAHPFGPVAIPVSIRGVAAVSHADKRHGQVTTAQAAQTLLFLLTMLLAGMVLSNLVEEKGNKIIEVLAAAIPMDALFLGKLFAMLAVSWVGICVWGSAGFLFKLVLGHLPMLDAPAVGWPVFAGLGIVYFSLAYLLIGSVFLAIGSMAATVRDVQTMSMPATMLQLLVFFFASFAMTHPGSPMEIAAVVVPFSSPFAMLARAATIPALWPHVLAIAWQAVSVAVFVRLGAGLFRTRVMKSGPSGGGGKKRRLFAR